MTPRAASVIGVVRAGGVVRAFAVASMLVLAPSPAVAQTLSDLSAACVQAGGEDALCSTSTVASRTLMGQTGLLAGFGSEVAGTATTLGARIGGGPRLSFSAHWGGLTFGLPYLGEPAETVERRVFVSALHTNVTVGLFDGLRIMPTVGGFLSVDVIGQAAFLFLPAEEGLTGSGRTYTAGVRVGIFREGFTVPGVSVSLSRRFPDDIRYGSDTGPASVAIQSGVTSLRATVGKDLFAVEWMAGVGWDDYDGDASLRVWDGLGGYATAAGEIDASRRLYFGSASMTFGIVLTLALEAGWADGFEAVPLYSGGHDPSAGTPFGSLSGRLTL